jgi:hypothetical protein
MHLAKAAGATRCGLASLLQRMRRYFLHVRDRTSVIIDDQGMELPDLGAARQAALAAARQLMSQAVLKGEPLDGRVFEIADQHGTVLLLVPFSEALATRSRGGGVIG